MGGKRGRGRGRVCVRAFLTYAARNAALLAICSSVACDGHRIASFSAKRMFVIWFDYVAIKSGFAFNPLFLFICPLAHVGYYLRSGGGGFNPAADDTGEINFTINWTKGS